MHPNLNDGEYVFCTIPTALVIDPSRIIGSFKETEGLTVILDKNVADSLHLNYTFIAAWITLTVHSSLEGVGFTAAFSNALAKAGIGCNVIAAYYHDHIFVAKQDTEKVMEVLETLSNE